MSLREEVFADYEAALHQRQKASWGGVFLRFFQLRGFRVAFLYRLARRAEGKGQRVISGLLERMIIRCGVSISSEADVGAGLLMPHPSGIVIGGKTRIGRGARILQGATLGGQGGRKRGEQSQPWVGDDALIGAGAALVGPIRVGDRVKIGANAVVTSDLPDDCVAVGVPARIVKIGDRRVSLLDQGGELTELLKDVLRRLERLEGRIGEDG